MITLWHRTRIAALNWLVTGLTLQLLVTLATAPFLLGWKLPYTPLSLLGNLLFPFFLIAFLGTSALFFLTIALGIPHGWATQALIFIQKNWTMMLTWRPPLWWFAIQWWHLTPALLLGCGLWIWHTSHYSLLFKKRLLLCCSIMALYTFFLGSCYQPVAITTTLSRGKHTLTCTPIKNNGLVLDDNGYLTRASNSAALVDYELLPHIITHYGQPTKIILHANHRSKRIQAVRSILKKWNLPTLISSD